MRNKLTRILVSFPFLFQSKKPKWCRVQVENIAGVRCRVYLPQGEHRKTNAAVIYIHGGGWCIMRPKFYDEPLLALIERLGCPVISIDYHLSPEAKFPSAILECERVVQEIHDNKFKDYNIDPNRIALMGDSAGGNISAVLCQRALRQKRVLAKCQVLVYPVIHLLDTLSPAYRHYYSTYKGSSLLNPKSLIRWYLMYLGIEATQQNIKAVMRNQHIPKELKEDIGINRLIDTSSLPTALLDKKSSDVKLPSPSVSTNTELAHKMKKFLADPNLCPLLGKDLTGLPPAMIVTAGVDILRDEGVLYARRMRDFGVPVQWSHYEAAFHGILHMPASKQRNQMLDDIAFYLQKNL